MVSTNSGTLPTFAVRSMVRTVCVDSSKFPPSTRSNNNHTMVRNIQYWPLNICGKAITKESFQMKLFPLVQLVLRSSCTAISTAGAGAPPLPLTPWFRGGTDGKFFGRQVYYWCKHMPKMRFSGDVANERQLPFNPISEAEKSLRYTFCPSWQPTLSPDNRTKTMHNWLGKQKYRIFLEFCITVASPPDHFDNLNSPLASMGSAVLNWLEISFRRRKLQKI